MGGSSVGDLAAISLNRRNYSLGGLQRTVFVKSRCILIYPVSWTFGERGMLLVIFDGCLLLAN